jgi:uncharacterized protein YbbC (DUF1343 family)
MLSKLFEVLDKPEPERGNRLDADLARFDYINGGPAMPSRQAVTTTIISNELIFFHADVRK